MKQEFTVKPVSGYLALLVAILLLGGAIAGFAYEMIWPGAILTLLFVFTLVGFTVVDPNGSCVMILFGAYKGTIRQNGFFWVNPFYIKMKISLQTSTRPILMGLPILSLTLIGSLLKFRALRDIFLLI